MFPDVPAPARRRALSRRVAAKSCVAMLALEDEGGMYRNPVRTVDLQQNATAVESQDGCG